MHAITEPVRQNKKQQGRDVERLRLEVVDLRQYTVDTGVTSAPA